MERIEILISKLADQYKEKASPEQMLFTLQLLQTELMSKQKEVKPPVTSKVSVLMPTRLNIDPAQYEKYAPKPVEETAAVKEKKEKVLVEDESVSIVQQNGQLDMVFDPLVEIPTLSHQVRGHEADSESLNDKLKPGGKVELVEVLKETPIKDLRKAIGINDRFVFINELFRGDEAMYERSIKTINSFNIYAEAEYWISRELKIKLGWDNDLPVVAQFDQLVKRRFS